MSQLEQFLEHNATLFQKLMLEAEVRQTVHSALANTAEDDTRLGPNDVRSVFVKILGELLDAELPSLGDRILQMARDARKTATERAAQADWQRPGRDPDRYRVLNRSNVGRLVRDLAAEEPRQDPEGFVDDSLGHLDETEAATAHADLADMRTDGVLSSDPYGHHARATLRQEAAAGAYTDDIIPI